MLVVNAVVVLNLVLDQNRPMIEKKETKKKKTLELRIEKLQKKKIWQDVNFFIP